MGEITRDEIVQQLIEFNPYANIGHINIYVDAMITYREANENISRNGAINAHPRTGAPIENPYLKVRKAAGETLTKLNIDPGDIWDR